MKELTLLLSSAGRRVELLRCFRRDAHELGVNLKIIATDVAPDMSAACREADLCFVVPSVAENSFVTSLAKICESQHVDIVVPTIDTELAILASAQRSIPSVQIIVSNDETIRIASSKFLTAQKLGEYGIKVPATVRLSIESVGSEDLQCPLIVKPEYGSRSIGVERVDSLQELRSLAGNRSQCVAQNMISGREFTCNCYISRDGRLLSAVPHERLEVRAGEVSKGRTVAHAEIIKIASDIIHALPGLYGPFCFQCIIDATGDIWVFEINPRFGGGFPLTHHAGAPFTRWILEERLGIYSAVCSTWQNRVTMLRYDASIFFNSEDE